MWRWRKKNFIIIHEEIGSSQFCFFVKISVLYNKFQAKRGKICSKILLEKIVLNLFFFCDKNVYIIKTRLLILHYSTGTDLFPCVIQVLLLVQQLLSGLGGAQLPQLVSAAAQLLLGGQPLVVSVTHVERKHGLGGEPVGAVGTRLPLPLLLDRELIRDGIKAIPAIDTNLNRFRGRPARPTPPPLSVFWHHITLNLLIINMGTKIRIRQKSPIL